MQTPKSDSRLSIILPIKGNAKHASFEQIFNSFSKGKADVDCVLITSSNQKLADELKQNAAYQDLVQKQRLQVSKNYTEAFSLAGGATSLVVENADTVNMSALVGAAQAKRKKMLNNAFYFGSYFLKESANKNGIAQKISNAIYNNFVRFLTTSNINDNQSGVIIVNTDFAQQTFESKLSTAKNYFEIANQVGAHKINAEDVALIADKNSPSGSILGLFSLPLISLFLSFKFFVLSALHEIKTNAPKPENKGNAPVFRMIFYVLVFGFCIAYPLLSQQYGMTWDEKQHDEYSKVAYNWVTSFGEDTTALSEPVGSQDYVRQIFRHYGEHINLISAIIYNTFDTDPYDTRHFIISLYGLFGLICIGLTVKALTSWRGAIIALLFVGLNPSWMGFSMNNPTDIPFAVGFAVSGYFMVRVLQNMPNPKRKHISWLGIGVGIGIGSRVGAILIIAYMGLFLGVQWLWYCIKNKKGIFSEGVLTYLKTFLSIAGLGYLFGISLWPYALSNPFKNVYIAFKKSSENAFYANNTELLLFNLRH